MGKKAPKPKRASKRWIKYKIEGGSLKRSFFCPKCGVGIFLAEHKDRKHCGKCGYMEKK
ncbi:30S ribosomal protein S27ae [Candidatus Woesearchaeota archaeon]|nr:30S ribosomal protein S27ae [Candidatus Woesearchaeota archaeon]